MRTSLKTKILLILAIFFFVGIVAAQAADPVVIEVHYQNGIKFYKRGLYDRAITEFEKTLSLDPEHKEAKGYLEKLKDLKNKETRVEAKRSEAAELKSLYDDGKRLFASRDYNGAMEIFDKILAKKPVDDFASFYKERCEIYISHELTRKKKKEEKARLVEERAKEKLAKKDALSAKKKERAEISEKSRQITEERRQLRQARTDAAGEALSAIEGNKPVKELSAKEQAKNNAKAQKEERVRAAQEAKLERKRLAEEKKEEARALAEKKKEEKKAAAEEKRQKKNAKKLNIEKVEATSETLQNKELFLRGVAEYGRKEYETAIATFKSLIESESSSRKLYTNSAKRLLDKAKKKLEAARKAEDGKQKTE